LHIWITSNPILKSCVCIYLNHFESHFELGRQLAQPQQTDHSLGSDVLTSLVGMCTTNKNLLNRKKTGGLQFLSCWVSRRLHCTYKCCEFWVLVASSQGPKKYNVNKRPLISINIWLPILTISARFWSCKYGFLKSCQFHAQRDIVLCN
jgi:hypothetical protein